MKVFVVTADSYGGDEEVSVYTSVVKVFSNEEAAKKFVKEKNAARTSSWDSEYDYTESDMD